jgi:hypothetical protein
MPFFLCFLHGAVGPMQGKDRTACAVLCLCLPPQVHMEESDELVVVVAAEEVTGRRSPGLATGQLANESVHGSAAHLPRRRRASSQPAAAGGRGWMRR